jgi:hypothetical protein
VFSNVVENNSTTILQDWVPYLNNGTKRFLFRMVGHNYATHIFNPLIGFKQLVCKVVFETSIVQVRGQCYAIANMFIIELNRQFVDFELMIDLGIVYPQFWM